MSQNIEEILKSADIYLKLLQSLQQDICVGQEQLKQSAKAAETDISEFIDAAIKNVTLTLQEQRNLMIKSIKEQELESVLLLDESLLRLVCKINDVKLMVSYGKELLNDGKNLPRNFLKGWELIKCVPEVPSLVEIPCFTFERNPNFEENLLDLCQKFGNVTISGPVQITSLLPRPGGFLVEWELAEREHNSNSFEFFHLQKADGDPRNSVDKNSQFQTVYIGKENQALVLNLENGQLYTFRVCCKADVKGYWSSWSLLRSGTTILEPYKWAVNENYKTYGKFARPLMASNMQILYSHQNIFHQGYSIKIEFRTVEDENEEVSKGNFIGLFTDDKQKEFTDIYPQSILVEATGHIYIQGIQKSTKFPQLHAEDVVTFTCELQEENKLRVNIDVNDKRVTYDWSIDNTFIYVGAILKTERWTIGLE